ncbi:MAG: NAD-glutamate dehydrogenase, partial [Actinomycetota bacterium]|nr:NAD-glutamate dehydrogenase [Actinomycetota bacterium]
EIVATQICNQMVNLSGISFDHRLSEETGLGVVEITRAWLAVRDIFGLPALWEQVDALSGAVKLDMQLELFLELRTMAERAVLWLLRHRKAPIDIAAAVAEFQPGIASLGLGLEAQLCGRMRQQAFALEAGRLAANVPEIVAQRSVLWPLLHTGFDVVDLAARTNTSTAAVASAYWKVFDELDLMWLWEAIGRLPRSNRWQTQARSALRDDLLAAMGDLAEDAILAGSVADWMATNERMLGRATALFTEIRRVDAHDLTTLSVALRQLRNLALLS